MFTSHGVKLLYIIALLFSACASPLAVDPLRPRDLDTRGGHVISFNEWRGFSSLDNFDTYGSDDFCRARFNQVIVKEREVEMAKKIITEQICEVETQTIVLSQFHGSLGLFSNDLRRRGHHAVGFD
ncbi:hypothetical protein VNI00_005113 [Paramarasmius palmivorus]|uniref:Uncharacterized protein n=1 Tax=Paramarasmius palmivorus TaxID=297713 RepID=A0AAW0DK75_9AGAR